ncbi:MAG: Gfo/Idh/MocA family oxidoreductase [Planctomycetaceae bacterium]
MAQKQQAGTGRHASRRDFLKTSAAAAGTAWWVSGKAYGFQDSKNPMERLNFACIGVAGKGSSDSADAAGVGKIVAICDIDERSLKKKAADDAFTDAKQFVDFRVMLDEMGDQIDAITVSTPDHTHAVAAAAGLKLGKHVFCQKPLTWSIEEARVLRELFEAKKGDGVCTQMGNQGTADTRLREGVEFLRTNPLGEIKEVHIWTNRPIWPQGEGRPKETAEPPKFLHWDLFLGPAPERPYNPTAYHPFKWRGWIDFGTGALGDMACHTANLPVMALNLFDPVSVVAESSGIVENETYPKNSKITFQFPERAGHDGKTLPPVTVIWYDGGNKPDPALLMGEKMSDSGFLVIGSESRMYSPHDYGGVWLTLPKDKEFPKAKQTLARAPQSVNGAHPHMVEFANACRARKPEIALSNFDYATHLTETILWGNVALRAGQEVKIDRDGKITSPSDASQYLGRKYREGWTL